MAGQNQHAVQTRNSKGQFVPGTAGGPGRKSLATEKKYLKSLTAVLTIDEWREIVLKAIEDAKTGDRYAREWLGKYAIGDKRVSDLEGRVPEIDMSKLTNEELGELARLLAKANPSSP